MTTVYCSSTQLLPITAMAELCEGATFSASRDGEAVSQYIYRWPDATLHINVMPASEIAGHLDGFVGYLQNIEQKTGAMLAESLLSRIRETILVLGFVVTSDSDTAEDDCFERLQDAIGMICFNTGSLVFWEGRVYDENAELLFPVDDGSTSV